MTNFNSRLIFLIGFMGAGKTHIGKLLSEKMNIPFFDLDEYIEGKASKSILEIFQNEGEEAFRILERKCLRDFGVIGNAVVAVGGGTPCFFDNVEWMNDQGVTIYLKASPELLAKRLASGKLHRPLIAGLSTDALIDFITTKLKERSDFYEKASVVVDQEEVEFNVVEEIYRNFTNITGH